MKRLLIALAALAVVLTCTAGRVIVVSGPMGVSAAPVFVAAGTAAASADGSGVTPTVPAHQAGDILMAQQRTDITGTPGCSTAGWTQITTCTFGSLHKAAWYWKRAESSSETNPTFTGGVNTYLHYAQVYVFRGATASGTPYEDATIKDCSWVTDITTAEIETTGANRLVVSLAVIHNDTAWLSGPPPSGWTTGNDITTAVGADGRLTEIHIVRATASTIASVTIGSFSGPPNAATLTLAIVP